MDMIHHVVTDGTQLDDTSPTMTANGDSGISLAQHQPTAARASKDFDVRDNDPEIAFDGELSS